MYKDLVHMKKINLLQTGYGLTLPTQVDATDSGASLLYLKPVQMKNSVNTSVRNVHTELIQTNKSHAGKLLIQNCHLKKKQTKKNKRKKK